MATERECDEFARTTDANVAAVNGFEHVPVAIETDSLTLGPRMGTLIKRMSRTREGESFDEELERLHGFRDGMWSAPVADRFWRARSSVQSVRGSGPSTTSSRGPRLGLVTCSGCARAHSVFLISPFW